MVKRLLLRYFGIFLGLASALVVPKIMYSELDDVFVSRLLLALSMGAVFAFFDFGLSRNAYVNLVDLPGDEARKKLSLHLSSLLSATVFASMAGVCALILVEGNSDAQTIKLVPIFLFGLVAATAPWYKNLCDAIGKLLSAEFVLFSRRIMPILLCCLVLIGIDVAVAGLVLVATVILLYCIPLQVRSVNLLAGISIWIKAITLRARSYRAALVWSVSENLLYVSPVWVAFMLFDPLEQGAFVVLFRAYHAIIGVLRAPIDIIFVKLRAGKKERILLLHDVYRLTIFFGVLVILIAPPIYFGTNYVVFFATNGEVSVNSTDAVALICLLGASMMIHPIGLFSTSYVKSMRTAAICSGVGLLTMLGCIVCMRSINVVGFGVSELLLAMSLGVATNALSLHLFSYMESK